MEASPCEQQLMDVEKRQELQEVSLALYALAYAVRCLPGSDECLATGLSHAIASQSWRIDSILNDSTAAVTA